MFDSANYLRMPPKSNVWKTNWPMTFISDTDEWVQRRLSSTAANAHGEWTLYGGQMHIFLLLRGVIPATPTSGEIPAEAASFVEINKNCIARAAGGFSVTFVEDGDRFVLSERPKKLGMIWQWKASKGSPYAEDMGTYQDAIVMAMGSDRPSPILIDPPARAPPLGIEYAGTW